MNANSEPEVTGPNERWPAWISMMNAAQLDQVIRERQGEIDHLTEMIDRHTGERQSIENVLKELTARRSELEPSTPSA